MTVLVVGGNGFIGSHIVDALLASGRRVRVLSPHPELFRPPREGVDYHFGRLELGAHLEPAVEGCEAVIDAVSSSVPSSADQSPASAIANAVGGSTWLGELCQRAGVGTLVYLSSGGTVYGRGAGERPHRESDAMAPIGTYGALKAATELSLAALLGESNVRHVCLRVANAYGERQNPSRPQGIVGVALARLLAGQAMTLYGDTVRDFVHAADVASAVTTVLGADVRGTFNVGSGAGTAISDLLARLEAVTGRPFAKEILPARHFDVPYSVVDISKIGGLGWTPAIDLDAGLRATWQWFQDNAAAPGT